MTGDNLILAVFKVKKDVKIWNFQRFLHLTSSAIFDMSNPYILFPNQLSDILSVSVNLAQRENFDLLLNV